MYMKLKMLQQTEGLLVTWLCIFSSLVPLQQVVGK
jgi:hypothetical protein